MTEYKKKPKGVPAPVKGESEEEEEDEEDEEDEWSVKCETEIGGLGVMLTQ